MSSGSPHDAYQYSRSHGVSSGEQCVHRSGRRWYPGDTGRSRGCRSSVGPPAGVTFTTLSPSVSRFADHPDLSAADRLVAAGKGSASDDAGCLLRICRMSHGWHNPILNAYNDLRVCIYASLNGQPSVSGWSRLAFRQSPLCHIIHNELNRLSCRLTLGTWASGRMQETNHVSRLTTPCLRKWRGEMKRFVLTQTKNARKGA